MKNKFIADSFNPFSMTFVPKNIANSIKIYFTFAYEDIFLF